MNPVFKWAIWGAALAFVQYFIFNGAHQHGWVNRAAFGVLGILVWAALGALVGLVIWKVRKGGNRSDAKE